MSKRIFVLGAGVFGTHLARRLMELGSDVVIIDRDAETVRQLSDKGYNVLELDSEDVDALSDSGVTGADAAVVAIGDNIESSLLTTLSLRDLKVPRIVARATNAQHAQALVRLGAHRVLLPLRDTAWALAERLTEGSVSSRIPLAGAHQLAEAVITDKVAGDGSELQRLLTSHGVRLILAERAQKGRDSEVWESASGYAPRTGDRLLFAGPKEKLDQFERAIAEE